MIDSALLKRLLLLAAALFALSAAGLLIAGLPAFAGGLGLGYVLGALPFASWAWIATRGFESKRNRVLAAVLMFGKLGVYSGALYLCVTRNLVNPVGVLVGVTGVAFIVIVGGLLAPAPRAKGVA
jgi:hypothetical protein